MTTRLLIAALLFFTLANSAHSSPSPRPSARAWLIQLDGKIIGAHQAQQALPPASLTKIMTAILWLQKPARQNEIVTISTRAAAETGSRAGLKAGEHYRGSELLAAMLIASANDACMALAEQAAGSSKAFVADMNRAARTLGLRETHFTNPCGHDAPGHTSSARDLLRLSEVALENPTFRTLVATTDWPLHKADGSSTQTLHTRNALLGRLEGTRGVKTGYTTKAGACVIALVERKGRRVILVLLNAKNRWWTAHQMIEQAFAHASP